MRTTVFTIDRMFLPSRGELAETIAGHLVSGEIIQVEDGAKPRDERLRYTIQMVGEAGHVFDGRGRPLGVFADLDALVDHAEATTA